MVFSIALLTIGFLYHLTSILTHVGMTCGIAYDFMLAGVQKRASILDMFTLAFLALALLWVLSIFGLTSERRGLTIHRATQAALLGTLLFIILVHWSYLVPVGKHYEITRELIHVFNLEAPQWHNLMPERVWIETDQSGQALISFDDLTEEQLLVARAWDGGPICHTLPWYVKMENELFLPRDFVPPS